MLTIVVAALSWLSAWLLSDDAGSEDRFGCATVDNAERRGLIVDSICDLARDRDRDANLMRMAAACADGLDATRRAHIVRAMSRDRLLLRNVAPLVPWLVFDAFVNADGLHTDALDSAASNALDDIAQLLVAGRHLDRKRVVVISVMSSLVEETDDDVEQLIDEARFAAQKRLAAQPNVELRATSDVDAACSSSSSNRSDDNPLLVEVRVAALGELRRVAASVREVDCNARDAGTELAVADAVVADRSRAAHAVLALHVVAFLLALLLPPLLRRARWLDEIDASVDAFALRIVGAPLGVAIGLLAPYALYRLLEQLLPNFDADAIATMHAAIGVWVPLAFALGAPVLAAALLVVLSMRVAALADSLRERWLLPCCGLGVGLGLATFLLSGRAALDVSVRDIFFPSSL